MALSQQLKQRQTQKLVMTQDLRQSIELLSLSNMELRDRLQKELLENPLLEEQGSAASESADALQSIQSQIQKESLLPGDKESADDPEFQARRFEDADRFPFTGAPDFEGTESKHQFLENAVEAVGSLQDHLIEQLRLVDISPKLFEAGKYLISCIDDHGFVAGEPSEILTDFSLSSEEMKQLLHAIYNLEPIGCGTSGITHSLAVQAQILYPDKPNVRLLIEKYLDLLEKLNYEGIEEKTGLSAAEIDEALQRIRNLEPYPGSRYAGHPPSYVIPELLVVEIEGRLEVLLNDDSLPRLRINPENEEVAQSIQDPSDREYLQNKLASAQWLITGIAHRQATLLKVMKSIVIFQEAYFRKGPAFLKPLTLREVADDIEMHESTVSRITTNKYVETKWGIVELKYFFSSSVRSESGGGDHSSTSVQERIKRLIQSEDPQKPLSDQAIVQLLKEEGIKIARRTVAKYRNLLGILPADRRRHLHRIAQKKMPEKTKR